MFQQLSSDLLTQPTTKKSLQQLLLLIPIKFSTLINNNKINTKINFCVNGKTRWGGTRMRVELKGGTRMRVEL